MPLNFIIGMLRITNLLISIFILLYAYLFLNKAAKRTERRPWDYLFIASFIFLLYQIFSLTYYFSKSPLPISSSLITMMVEFLYSGLILLAFVSQHELIIRSPLLLISRKSEKEK